jgi:hypothetical protein
MDRHECLTNEKLSKKFVSQFDLVNFAVHVAKDMIKSGRETRARKDIQNRAQQILEEITEDKVLLNDIDDEQQFEKMRLHEQTFIEKKEMINVG